MVTYNKKKENEKKKKIFYLSIISFLVLLSFVFIVFAIEVSDLIYPLDNAYINQHTITFNFTSLDDANVSMCTLYANFTGTFESNKSIYPSTNNSHVWNITVDVPDGYYIWNIRCIDNESVPNVDYYTDDYTLTVDTLFPSWYDNETNASPSTKTGDDVYFNITLTDKNPKDYVFSYYDVSSWNNESASLFEDGEELTITKTVTATRSQTLSWFWFINDSAGNLNMTKVWSITVNNTPPTHETPILNATDFPLNKTTANLTCFYNNPDDADSDGITFSYKWYKDGVLQDAFDDESHIDSSNTLKGESWVCEITPYDGFDYGVSKNSSAIDIENSLPAISLTSTNVDSPNEDSEVYIYVNVSDIDEDDITCVNLTLIAPNGTIIIDNVNISYSAGYQWNSTPFLVDMVGLWTWNITSSDSSVFSSINSSFFVDFWHLITGNLTGSLVLEDNTTSSLINWNVFNATGSNIYITDYGSNINFNSLLALSKDKNDVYQKDDFDDLDILLNMTWEQRSINNTYTFEDDPINTESFVLFGYIIEDVPTINTSAYNNFTTGILWDSSDDLSNNDEFDIIDKEDIVFITKVNEGGIGKYGSYDYEIDVPSNLKRYYGDDILSVTMYAEIR